MRVIVSLALIPLFLGLYVGVWGTLRLRTVQRDFEARSSAPGVILGYEEGTRPTVQRGKVAFQDQTVYRPVVAWTSPDGRRHTFRSELWDSRPGFSVDTSERDDKKRYLATVLYVPGQPDRAEVEVVLADRLREAKSDAPILWVAVTVPCALLTLLLLWKMPRIEAWWQRAADPDAPLF